MAMIHEAICHIMQKGCAISKDKRNEQQRFMYRGIDDVMNAFNPLMAEEGVFIVPEVLDAKREDRVTGKGGNLIYSILTMRYTFYAKDGSSVSAVVQGEGMDSGDKASNKAMAVAMKYAMFQTFCIPTEDMPDPDAETPPPSKPVQNNAQKSTERTAEQKQTDMEQFYRDEAAKLIQHEGDTEYSVCDKCGGYIYNVKKKDGSIMSVHEYLIASLKTFGKPLCNNCRKEAMKQP